MKKWLLGLFLGGFLGIFDGLSALVSAPEVASDIVGIVIGSTQPPGYENLPPTSPEQFDIQLGYTTAARQAFIRKTHADPIDLSRRSRNHSTPSSAPAATMPSTMTCTSTGTLTAQVWPTLFSSRCWPAAGRAVTARRSTVCTGFPAQS